MATKVALLKWANSTKLIKPHDVLNETKRVKRPDFRELFRALTAFSRREQRRILLLIPLLIVVSLLFVRQGRPCFERSFLTYSDHLLKTEDRTKSVVSASSESVGGQRDSLFSFDPNTIDRAGLVALGFTPKQAQGILNYRSAGAIFRKAEDFARCYTVSEKMFARLMPYIQIGEDVARESDRSAIESEAWSPTANHLVPKEVAGKIIPQKMAAEKKFTEKDSLFAFDPNTIDKEGLVALGFTSKEAQGILNYRSAGAVFRKAEDFARCYTVSNLMFRRLVPYLVIPESVAKKEVAPQKNADTQGGVLDEPDPMENKVAPKTGLLELNGADSVALVAVRGIGAVTAGRIAAYREHLGGYACVEQLQEIEGMTEKNYLLILQQIYVDSSKIQKIDINFAAPKRLKGHPYLPPKVLNKILKYRQLKGGWSSTRDLIEQHILSQEQAARLAPYLCFGVL